MWVEKKEKNYIENNLILENPNNFIDEKLNKLAEISEINTNWYEIAERFFNWENNIKNKNNFCNLLDKYLV